MENSEEREQNDITVTISKMQIIMKVLETLNIKIIIMRGKSRMTNLMVVTMIVSFILTAVTMLKRVTALGLQTFLDWSIMKMETWPEQKLSLENTKVIAMSG